MEPLNFADYLKSNGLSENLYGGTSFNNDERAGMLTSFQNLKDTGTLGSTIGESYLPNRLPTGGIDFDWSDIGGLFSSEKGGTSVMGGLAPYMQLGMSYLADKKNDASRANNETIQRQQIASNTYNADKRNRNDLALGRAFGTM